MVLKQSPCVLAEWGAPNQFTTRSPVTDVWLPPRSARHGQTAAAPWHGGALPPAWTLGGGET